ncbi:hypothetical protein BpHYR1_018775 [Brachionus plicatilis]|uniref:RNA-directed DNA polymerase from mobile element jockey-like n=1 Tax=Brachionus plicatilis TaxID=10195 RepID=A0A3M7QYE2_BRAPC|nr:hypothetical protein BpHYR1_018775 [Brachionus plicatilis]
MTILHCTDTDNFNPNLSKNGSAKKLILKFFISKNFLINQREHLFINRVVNGLNKLPVEVINLQRQNKPMHVRKLSTIVDSHLIAWLFFNISDHKSILSDFVQIEKSGQLFVLGKQFIGRQIRPIWHTENLLI